MPHVSSRKIPEKELSKLYKKFLFLISSGKRKSPRIFEQFFSRTEKIMFAKRLAVILMLDSGMSSYEITHALYMSPATLARMSLKYEEGKYDEILKIFSKNKGMENFEDFLYAVLSPSYSKRNKHLKKLME